MSNDSLRNQRPMKAYTSYGTPKHDPPDSSDSFDSTKSPLTEPPISTPNHDNDDITPPIHAKTRSFSRAPLWSELNTSEMTSTFQDPSQELFSRAIAALLDSRKINVTHSAFDHLILLAEEYLCNLIEELKKAARIQRRTTPSISDTLMLLHLSGLRLSLLDDECEKEKEMPTILPPAWTEIELSMLPNVDHDSSELFLTSRGSDVASLIPSRKQRGSHIPNWMPPFPPDHTFMKTPSLPERVTDPRALREMIVQEGQLAEHALRRLTGVIEVDENAAHDDDDADDAAISAFADELLEDVPMGNVNGSISLTKLENKGLQNLSIPSASNSITPSNMNGSIPTRPILALKLSLGSSAENGGISSVGLSPQSINKMDFISGKPISSFTTKHQQQKQQQPSDPFDLKSSQTKKKFNVVDYVHKRIKLVQKWKAKEDAQAERARAWQSRLIWQSNLANPGASSSLTEEPRDEDKDPDGLGVATSLVEHEYTAALAKIQKSKDDEAKKESIVDTGIVNWERDRYTWANSA